MRWSRSSRDDDGIGVSVGEGSWRLAATTADAEAVIELLDAAAAGSVSEDIETQENGSRRPVTLVGTPSREWRAEGPVLPDGHGVVMLGADVAQRLQRGRVEYVAWDGAGGA
ncbi:MAG: ABC transporter permease [Microbacterium arborescens]